MRFFRLLGLVLGVVMLLVGVFNALYVATTPVFQPVPACVNALLIGVGSALILFCGGSTLFGPRR
jgi:hypothetical protein